MKNIKQSPRMGRPVKIPTASELENFGLLRLFLDDVVKIFKRCGAPLGTDRLVKSKVVTPPPQWAEVDAKGRPWKWAKVDANGRPIKHGCMLVKCKPVHVPVESQACWGYREAALILRCLNAPILLISTEEDSPKLRSIPLSFARLFAEAPNTMIEALPQISRLLQKRFSSPKYAAAITFAISHDERLWLEPMNVVADNYKRELQIPVTKKGIEHTRSLVRENLKKFSQKAG